MTGFFGTDTASQVGIWVAALLTLIVLGGLLGEKRLFGWSQHLLAGLATGFLALLAISEVIVPRLIQPLAVDPLERPELWGALVLLVVAAGAPWLPRVAGAVPVSIAIGSLAAFALGGAVIGTILPQLAAGIARPGPDLGTTVASAGGAAISGLVLFGFVHGTASGRLASSAARAGRWLMLAGLGGWLGYLLLSRLVLLLDRLAFLLGDWLGLVR